MKLASYYRASCLNTTLAAPRTLFYTVSGTLSFQEYRWLQARTNRHSIHPAFATAV
jgi:hypothetical protein